MLRLQFLFPTLYIVGLLYEMGAYIRHAKPGQLYSSWLWDIPLVPEGHWGFIMGWCLPSALALGLSALGQRLDGLWMRKVGLVRAKDLAL